jgi:hypothetical protein
MSFCLSRITPALLQIHNHHCLKRSVPVGSVAFRAEYYRFLQADHIFYKKLQDVSFFLPNFSESEEHNAVISENPDWPAH